MRQRGQIEADPKGFEALTLEVLLDIRDLLAAQPKAEAKPKRPPGRPKGTRKAKPKRTRKAKPASGA